MSTGVPSLVAGVAAACSVLLLGRPAPRALLRRRLFTVHRGVEVVGGWRLWPNRAGSLATLLAAAIAITVAVLVFGGRPHLVILAVAGIGVWWAVVTLRRRRRRHDRATKLRASITDMCDALVAELSAGIPPPTALADLAHDWPILQPAAVTARLGGEVPQALASAAERPGAGPLRHLAAAWEISARTGAPLSGVVDRLAGAMRDEQEARVEVTAALGAPRATARLLAVLPVFGLALGGGLGGEPWKVLTGSMLGAVCVVSGAGLAVAGVFWVEHIAAQAESD